MNVFIDNVEDLVKYINAGLTLGFLTEEEAKKLFRTVITGN